MQHSKKKGHTQLVQSQRKEKKKNNTGRKKKERGAMQGRRPFLKGECLYPK